MDILFELAKKPANEGIPWTSHTLFLLNRILASEFIEIISIPERFTINKADITPLTLLLTTKGREFIGEFGSHWLSP